MRRILFADNDPDFLNTRAEFLELAGYTVLKAPSLADAERCLRELWSPVVILDIRLIDDSDEKDLSGLGLAKMEVCQAVVKIMLTGYPTTELVRELLGLQRSGQRLAVDVVGKDEGPEALIEALDRAFFRDVRVNQNLTIHWNTTHSLTFPHLAGLIEPDLQGERLLDRADELDDLFRRLFYEKSQITIGRLLWQRKGRIAVNVFTFAPDQPSEPVLVICGPPERILDEHQRYRKYAPVGAAPPGATLATASEYAETTHFAAFALAGLPLDQRFQTLDEFYRSNPERRRGEMQALLDSVAATLAAWHHDQRIPAEPAASEAELYQAHLNLASMTSEDFDGRLAALEHEAAAYGITLTFTDEACSLSTNRDWAVAFPNPGRFLFTDNANSGPAKLCAITPGTLTPENVLITLDKGLAWLTDFEDAGPLPPLWNFTGLEAALRFDLIACDNLVELYEMEHRLTELGALGQLDTQTQMAKSVRPTLQWIELLRRKAASVVGQTSEAYHRGMLFHAANRVLALKPQTRLSRPELVRGLHALLAVGLISERLLKAQPLSTDSPAILRLDPTNKKAWVGERAVHLTETEYELLAYLASQDGRLM